MGENNQELGPRPTVTGTAVSAVHGGNNFTRVF